MPRAWHLESRPNGMPTADDFGLHEITVGDPGPGEIRVVNRFLSVDPYMRGRMNDVKSYVPPFGIGEPMTGGAIGEVVSSNAEGFSVGDWVQHFLGWRDEAVMPAATAQKLPPIKVPPQAFLGQFGMTGMTGYFGLLAVAEAKEGDTLFVSAAAGAVGSTVVQVAKAKGMTVIGSAGGADKCDWLKSLGADHCIDYKSGTPVVKLLGQAAPGGIDVYFDNVGGDHLDAALAHGKERARFAICGMIDVYNSGAATELRYAARIIGMRMRIQGFIVSDFMARAAEFYADIGRWHAEGKLRRQETILDGLERTPEAFLGLFSGANRGKMLVKV